VARVIPDDSVDDSADDSAEASSETGGTADGEEAKASLDSGAGDAVGMDPDTAGE
jgi:hypothetical protein